MPDVNQRPRPSAAAPRTGNAAADRALRVLNERTGSLVGAPFLEARDCGRITLVSATRKTFAHGLGRVPAGWQIIDMTIVGLVRRVSMDERTLVLESVGDVEGALWAW